VNGYQVAVKDSQRIVDRMEHSICNPNTNLEMGDVSLKIAKEEYNVKSINQPIMQTMGLI